MLFPINSKSRRLTSLDGSWEFKLGDGKKEFDESFKNHILKDTRPMPVPSSFNDIYEDVRDYFGWVFYQKVFDYPKSDKKDLILRFDSVTHFAKVFLNDELIGEHKGGFLPFEIDITGKLKEEGNILTLAVSNVINYSTLPVGGLNNMMQGFMGIGEKPDVNQEQKENNPNFDFFNYAGIQRHVWLMEVEKNRIDDISIVSEIEGSLAKVSYKLATIGEGEASLKVYDEDKNLITTCVGKDNTFEIKDVKLWDVLKAYHYEFRFTFADDEYVLDQGIRKIEVKDGQFLLNDKPVYFKGYGKHEDYFPNGRGFNEVLSHKDFSLMKKQGANSFRTSHYPYAEETIRLADRLGFLVIDETTAVGLNGSFGGGANFNGQALSTFDKHGIADTCGDHHRDVIRDLIARDKNYACVVIWSIANEPDSTSDGAYEYFKDKFDLARKCDPQKRPCTLVSVQAQDPLKDVSAKLSDVICLNRYYGWYFGGPDLVKPMDLFRKELDYWNGLNKPIIITEYGADTIAGFNDYSDYPGMYTEEFQVAYYKASNAVMDEYENIVGEHPWNFADFATAQGLLRINGNKKGIFTRDRKPKLAAFYFQERWNKIDNNFDKKNK